MDINFDCIGGKGHDGIWIDQIGFNMQSIYDKISSQFDIIKEETMSSDHSSFENGIGISTYDSSNQDLSFDIIHTPLDTPDTLDIEYIKTFSEKFNIILSDLATDEHTFRSFEKSQQIMYLEDSSKFEFGEYKYIDYGQNFIIPVANLNYSSKDTQIIKYFIDDYDKLLIEQVFLGFNHNIIPVYDDSKELDKIYTLDYDKLTIMDINSFSFDQFNDSNSMTIYISKNNKIEDAINIEYQESLLKKHELVEKDGVKYYFPSNPYDRLLYSVDDNETIYYITILYFKYKDTTHKNNVELTSDDIFSFIDEYKLFDLVNNIIDKIK